MGESTEIAWTDHTFNPWWGCQRVSPGCEHCYAETWAKRWGHDVWGPASTPRRFFGDAHWREPLKWNRGAEKAGVRARVFCSSMADVFEDRRDLDEHRARLFDLIRETPWLDWQLLTKRPENMRRLAPWEGHWPPNVWAGTTVENQEQAAIRIPHILDVPAAVRFLSCEPLLGPVHLVGMSRTVGAAEDEITADDDALGPPLSGVDGIDWVIVGGESGPKARPFDLAWARDILGQCRDAGVAAFMKQLGVNAVEGLAGADARMVGTKNPKGGDPAEWPEDLRVRELPESAR